MKKVVIKKIIICCGIIILFILLEIFILNKKNKYSMEYKINDFTINEEYNFKVKNSYYLNIMDNKNVYSYQWHSAYDGKKIVTDIKKYENKEMTCILPIFDGKIKFDILCSYFDSKSSSIDYIYYNNIENKSDDLISFASSIKEYDASKFSDEEECETIDIYNLNRDNLVHNLSLENYRGIININKKDKSINIFSSDKYLKELSTYTKNYYMVPDYDEEYAFKKIYIVNLKNNELKMIKLEDSISYASYIQGVDGDTIYLFDLENKKQYKINCHSLNIELIGSLKKNAKIYDESWKDVSVSEIIDNEPYFDFEKVRIKSNNGYIDNYNDYIYTFEKIDDGYNVYKSNKYTPNLRVYLFNIGDIESIIYKDEYIYFRKDDFIGYYSDFTGIKKIIQGNELLFNNKIKYTIL